MYIKYTQQQKDKVVELRISGLTFREIAVQLGMKNITPISELCERAGLPKRNIVKFTYEPGQRFNSFIILKPAPHILTENNNKYTRWECKCDCGKIFKITTKQIRRGQQSCGCHTLDSQFRKIYKNEQINIIKAIHNYKNGAKRRGFAWGLTDEQAIAFMIKKCFYCGIEPNRKCEYIKHCPVVFVSGIDRVDSKIGYELSNCVSCCQRCNAAKNDMTQEEFDRWIKRLVSFRYGVDICI